VRLRLLVYGIEIWRGAVHHTMNAEQRQAAADLWIKPTDLSHSPPGNHIHHRHLLFPSPKDDIRFTIQKG